MIVSGSDPRDSLLAAGLANQQRGRYREAEQCYRVLLAQRPRDFDALYRMGVLALQCANAAGAVRYLRAAGEVRALDADGWYNLGMAYALDYAFAPAHEAFGRALAIDPAHASAAIGLGNVCKFLGEPLAAAHAYLAAVASPRIGPTLFSQILVGLHTNAAVDAQTLFELHREWARRYAEPLYPSAPSFGNAPDPERRLRLGLVSPSFNGTIVGHFLRGLLPALARLADVLLYDAGTERDAITRTLHGSVADTRLIASMADEDAAALVRGDAIDVLVDLAGHAPGNRLTLFARRPAPVQLTWLDYFDTTGLATIDRLVSDPVSTPESALADGSQRFVERVVRMPDARLCYAPPPYAPAVAPAPCLAREEVTFGCFGRADKIDAELIGIWSRVLAAVPGSRLILKSAGFAIEPVRVRVLASFAEHGIATDRIDFRGTSPHAQLLAEYGDVDIALDTFPYNGGATTCDALSMGVPVVTLAGSTMIARQGAALLAAAGCTDWVAHDADGYVAIARKLAADRAALARLRAGLRERVLASRLCDGEAFAAAFMGLVRDAWHAWCADEGRQAKSVARATGAAA